MNLNTSNEKNRILLYAVIRKLRRELGRKNIEFFAKQYLGHHLTNEVPEFHKEIFRLLKTYLRLGIAAPRGFAKSTIANFIYALHCLLYNEKEDILLISASAQAAEDWLRKIKYELENNEAIKNDFGGLLQYGEGISPRWTTGHIILLKGGKMFSQFRARGRGCQVRGLRPTKVICDDLEDEELVRSEEQRKFLEEWFAKALLGVVSIKQQVVCIGTLLHPQSLLSKLVDKKGEFERWETKKYKAITDEGKSLWEDRFPLDELLQKKFEIGMYAFQSEFMNDPLSSDMVLWRPEWLMKYDTLPLIKEKFMGIDPATSMKDSADKTGIVVWGVGEDGLIYEIESIQGRWGIWEFCDNVIKLYLKHLPVKIGIEEIALQQIFRPVLIKEALKRDIPLASILQPITLGMYKEGEKRASKDKWSRALTIIHLFEQGRIRMRPVGLVDQLVAFPTGSEDDLADAAVHGLHLIIRYSVRSKIFSSVRTDNKSFEIKDNKMPQLSSLEEAFRPKRDWRLGG